MKKKQTSMWNKLKTILIGVALTIGMMLIVGATRVNPPPLFPEIVLGQVDVETVQSAGAGGQNFNVEDPSPFFAIAQAEVGDNDDDNDFLDFFGRDERNRRGNQGPRDFNRRR